MNEHDLKPGLTDPSIKAPQALKASTTDVAAPQAASGYSGQPDDLHDLFGSTENFDGSEEDDPLAALRHDPNYSALIRDLEYIASQARLLFAPAEETPSDDLWIKIRSKMSDDPATE